MARGEEWARLVPPEVAPGAPRAGPRPEVPRGVRARDARAGSAGAFWLDSAPHGGTRLRAGGRDVRLERRHLGLVRSVGIRPSEKAGKEAREEAARRAAAAGPRTYGAHRAPNPAIVDPRKRIRTASKNPIIVAVDVTGSMATWPFEIFDRLPLLYNTLSQYRDDLEICFAAIGDARRRPLAAPGHRLRPRLRPRAAAQRPLRRGRRRRRAARATASSPTGSSTTSKRRTRKKPFLIVFGDAPMHRTIPKEQIARLLGETAPDEGHSPGKEAVVDPVGSERARRIDLEARRRELGHLVPPAPDGPAGGRGRPAVGARPSAPDRSSGSTTSSAPWTTRWGSSPASWGRFGDFKANMRARQDEAKVKSVADRIRSDGSARPRLPGCGAQDPPERRSGASTCSFCGSTLEL